MKRLIAEFEEQSFVQIIFPHSNTDWKPYLYEAQITFRNIIQAIASFEPCLVICHDIQEAQKFLPTHPNIIYVRYTTDDTWARDCSALSVCEGEEVVLYDFTFSGWGDKFASSQDNLLTQHLSPLYNTSVKKQEFVLEGGAIESNGRGLLLSTTACIYNPNRNAHLTKEARTRKLQQFFGAQEVLYLHHGHLEGDDTDSHIDTLARFIDTQTICYVQCTNTQEQHYETLFHMEQELIALAAQHNLTLVPLPLPSPLYYNNERLPATYANFLFVNGGVLVPVYGVKEDTEALKIFQKTFPTRKVVTVDCSVLVRQHGSLHCVTMQFPKGITLHNPSSQEVLKSC